MLKVCRLEEFVKKAELSDGIICFGAGRHVRRMEALFANTLVAEKIELFVDNNPERQKQSVGILGKSYDIISFEELKKKNIKNKIFLITCVKYTEIAEQIEKEEYFKSIECYCLLHLYGLKLEDEAMKKTVPDDLKISSVPLIPKVIHYCWFGGKEIPDKNKRWMESWHKYCPDYKIVEWNEENYDVTQNEYMRQAYQQKRWGFVPDYARLDIIYRFGGIYLDTDVELVKPLDDLLYQKGFAGFESEGSVALGLGFGAVAGLPVIKAFLDDYKNLSFYNDDRSLNLIPSPMWQTKSLEKRGLIKNGEYQIIDGLTILPEKVLSGKSGVIRRIRLAPFTRAIHHYDASWVDNDKKAFFINLEDAIQKLS